MGRWTDIAARQETTSQHGGTLSEHRGVVVHIAEGFYEGTISYQKGPNSVSSHFIVDRDGTICQMVDTDQEAWTQRAGNSAWMSIEFAGFTNANPLHASHPGWEKLTDQQMESAAKILNKAHQVYGVPVQIANDPNGKGLGHHSMGCNWPGGAWGHCDCPGDPIIAQKPTIISIAKGDDMAIDPNDPVIFALTRRVYATEQLLTKVAVKPGQDINDPAGESVALGIRFAALEAEVAGIATPTVDVNALAAALAPILAPMLPTASDVVDEMYNRLAD